MPRRRARTLALLETLQSKAPVGFGFVDRDYRRVLVNETLAAFNGSTVAEQLGQRVPDLVPLIWPSLEPLYRGVLETGRAVLDVEVDGPSQAHPEDIRHWLLSYYPVRVDGVVIGIGIVAVDNTERIRSERAHRLLSTIVENSGDAISGPPARVWLPVGMPEPSGCSGTQREEMVGRSLAVLAGDGRISPSSGGVGSSPVARPSATKASAVASDGSLVDVLDLRVADHGRERRRHRAFDDRSGHQRADRRAESP